MSESRNWRDVRSDAVDQGLIRPRPRTVSMRACDGCDRRYPQKQLTKYTEHAVDEWLCEGCLEVVGVTLTDLSTLTDAAKAGIREYVAQMNEDLDLDIDVDEVLEHAAQRAVRPKCSHCEGDDPDELKQVDDKWLCVFCIEKPGPEK